MAISDNAQHVLDWIEDHNSDALTLLERIVNIDSGTYDKEGVDAVATVIREFLSGFGVASELISVNGFGDILRATLPSERNVRPILLMGHRDTVFPRGETTRRPFEIRGGRAYGPGVADMKAGLVLNAMVLSAFAQCGAAPGPIVALFTGDEEVGSVSSRPIIEQEARGARAVLNAEPGRVNGNVVTGRKGGIFLTCTVDGKSAHSGVNFSDGASAIEEMARKITDWHALTDLDRGLTVNVGLVEGGQSVNSVAPRSSCEIDVRYKNPKERGDVVSALTRIAETCSVPGTRAALDIRGEFLPLEENDATQQLYEAYLRAARVVGFEAGGEFTGSSADSGFSAAVGTPTLCGLGPVGGKAHTPDEYIELLSIDQRTKAVALMAMNLPLQ